ncbi:MAG: hypothetical protein OEZ68_12010 [Gammaproteobacteria bacterium]|nr:hypothetical protein [Gammaproteobacteria bacterium]MDH5801518.1 hypothetical protein [Gammaproteobacteria bacterium]
MTREQQIKDLLNQAERQGRDAVELRLRAGELLFAMGPLWVSRLDECGLSSIELGRMLVQAYLEGQV